MENSSIAPIISTRKDAERLIYLYIQWQNPDYEESMAHSSVVLERHFQQFEQWMRSKGIYLQAAQAECDRRNGR